MKKKLLSVGLFALFSMLNACGSQNTEMIMPAPAVTEPVNNNQNPDPTHDQVNANSLLQPEIPVSRIANDIMYIYDHNKNGNIDYRSTATSYNDYYKSNENNRYITRQNTSIVNNVTVPVSYIDVYTRTKLFLASDKNNDGMINAEELISFISEKFDTNNDDILSSRGLLFWKPKNEYQLFNAAYQEEYFKRMDI